MRSESGYAHKMRSIRAREQDVQEISVAKFGLLAGICKCNDLRCIEDWKKICYDAGW